MYDGFGDLVEGGYIDVAQDTGDVVAFELTGPGSNGAITGDPSLVVDIVYHIDWTDIDSTTELARPEGC